MTKRALGYCNVVECAEYLKGVFLLDHKGKYDCFRCHSQGFIEKEISLDYSAGDDDVVYKTVRVHFDYDPSTKKYQQIAIVDVNELKLGSMYEVYSPLIRTKLRAFKVAERLLCVLNSGMKVRADGSNGTTEMVMYLNRGDWDTQLRGLRSFLAERERRISSAIEREL